MRKVVYNACYGGFSLSREAILLARELSGDMCWGGCYLKGEIVSGRKCREDNGYIRDIERHDSVLVSVVERLGKGASGELADLQVVIVDGLYRIDEYDGCERVMTVDDYEWK